MAKFSMSLCKDAYESNGIPVAASGIGEPRVRLHSTKEYPIGSRVRIRYGRNSTTGTVKRCERNFTGYDVEVQMAGEAGWLTEILNRAHGFDPGPLILDKFMSGEELSQLSLVKIQGSQSAGSK